MFKQSINITMGHVRKNKQWKMKLNATASFSMGVGSVSIGHTLYC